MKTNEIEKKQKKYNTFQLTTQIQNKQMDAKKIIIKTSVVLHSFWIDRNYFCNVKKKENACRTSLSVCKGFFLRQVFRFFPSTTIHKYAG